MTVAVPIPQCVLAQWVENRKPVAPEQAVKAWVHRIECDDKIVIGEIAWADEVSRFAFFLTAIAAKSYTWHGDEAVLDPRSFNIVNRHLVEELQVYGLQGIYKNIPRDIGMPGTFSYRGVTILEPNSSTPP